LLVEVKIDGNTYEVMDNEKILSLCLKVGAYVPHICFLKNHSPSGKCGLCVVDVNNGSTIALSCLTTVKDGMVIKTDSFAIQKIRRTNMMKLLNTHNTNCLNCFKAGACTFQEYISKIFEDSLDEVTNMSDTLSKNVYVNITEDILFNKAKCINCNRCVKFLCETCNMNCKFIDVADYSYPQSDDLYGNAIDICPTAALRSSNENFKLTDYRKKTVKTYDIASVFTPMIQVSTIDNKIVNIESCKNGMWITNSTRMVHHRLDKENLNQLPTVSPEQIAKELQTKTTEKKVFLVGEYIDIGNLFMLDYIIENNENCMMVIDDAQINKDLINKIKINRSDISYVDCAVFVGINQTSCRYYIKTQIKKLQAYYNVGDIKSIPDLKMYSNPYIFIGTSIFPCDISDFEQLNIPFSIIPNNNSQVSVKYVKTYTPLSEFKEKYNKHDIRFICLIGDTQHRPKYDVDIFQIKGKHFLEDSCNYINIFEEIVRTRATIQTSSKSISEFLIDVCKALYKENYEDILSKICAQFKSNFSFD
jgi:aerobic-type carbon monoxide dehydrogenase small subunit (CoxS/CutS family)